MEITVDSSELFWGVVFGVAIIILVVAVIIVRQFLRRARTPALDRAEVTRRWQRIEHLAAGADESSFRHAVIEADSVFDLAMKLKFFSGKDFGGRLKTAQAHHPKLRAIWQAHRLRNELVHESGTALRRGSAAHAISIYRSGLKELGLL